MKQFHNIILPPRGDSFNCVQISNQDKTIKATYHSCFHNSGPLEYSSGIS